LNKKSSRSQEKSELERVVDNFVPCGRCSFFLVGYRTIHGQEDLEARAQQVEDGWLPLGWNHETRRLVQESFGNRLDQELMYFDSRCPECQRRFVYEAKEGDEEPDRFVVELKAPQ
jgi:hypothetical protein